MCNVLMTCFTVKIVCLNFKPLNLKMGPYISQAVHYLDPSYLHRFLSNFTRFEEFILVQIGIFLT